MFMRKIKTALLALLLVCTLSISVFGQDIFAIKSVFGTPEVPAACTISTSSGNVLEFSAVDFERRLSLAAGELGGITITALPTATQGTLYLDENPVQSYAFIERQALNRLRFVPGETASRASLSFLPQSRDAVTTYLAIQILSTQNEPPLIEDASLETAKNTAKSGTVIAHDPEGGALTLQIGRKPVKGSVTFNGLSYQYTPFKDMTGTDSFTLYAVDNASAYSREAVVNVRIEKKSDAFFYTDMATHPSAYAALKLREVGIMTGTTVGKASFFRPDHTTTRGDYLVMLLSAAGLDYTLRPTVNTGLPNDSSIPTWLKPYVDAALRAEILPAGEPFSWNEVPIRAEAVVMIDRAADITDVKEYDLTMPDLNDVPSWAIPSYKDLAAYRMLDLHDGCAYPAHALTNSYAADLIWQLYKHRVM